MRILLPAFVVAVLVASFASAQPAQSVEHAPTVEQLVFKTRRHPRHR